MDLPAEVLLDPNTVLSDHYAQVTGVRPPDMCFPGSRMRLSHFWRSIRLMKGMAC